MSKLIDTHFHLDFYKNHRELYEQINKAEQYTLCVTNSPGVYLSCKKIYPETRYIKFALGFHPHEILKNKLSIKDFQLCMGKSIYIGEIGLDFSKDYMGSQQIQISSFSSIIKYVQESNKLASIHIRQAEYEAIEILEKLRPQKCIIHWFTGNEEQLQGLIKLGCYFSVNTYMVRNQSLINKVKLIPTEKLLVESDGPFTKVNGYTFSPSLLNKAYEIIAKAMGVANLREVVFTNFNRLLTL
mgnify:CR=1 FL=1